jgi:putative transposase
MIKTYKYKLRLTATQIDMFGQWLGATRLIYNLAKQTSECHYEATGKGLSAYDLQKQVVLLKKEYDWMRELPKDTLTAPLFRYEKAMKAFFKGAGFPKWASKRRWNSLVFVQQGNIMRIEDGLIKLHKGQYLRYFNSRALPNDAKIKQIILTKEINGWYASVQFETNQHRVVPASDSQTVGIDLGVKIFAALSTGELIANPRIAECFSRKLRIEQRSLARKKKGGYNWRKQAVRVAMVQQKIARCRNDWQHKVSTRLVSSYGGFVVEGLRVGNMTKSAKGTLENPGSMISQKSGLNRSLLDIAPSMFVEKLEYKCKWNGRGFQKINPAYTSQTCSVCGHVSKENRKTQSAFVCVSCGYTANADLNASVNILKLGGSRPLSANACQ